MDDINRGIIDDDRNTRALFHFRKSVGILTGIDKMLTLWRQVQAVQIAVRVSVRLAQASQPIIGHLEPGKESSPAMVCFGQNYRPLKGWGEDNSSFPQG